MTCGQHNKAIDSVSTIRFMVLISVVLSFLVGRGSLLIQCQEFEILFVPFISASILIYVRVYNSYVQSYAIIRKIYPFCPVFFIYTAFLGKNRGHRRVFCHSKQLILRILTARPLAQKVAQPLSRRPAKLAQICRRPHPPYLSLHPSFPSLHPSSPPHLSSCRNTLPPYLSLHPSFPPLLPSSPHIRPSCPPPRLSCPPPTIC